MNKLSSIVVLNTLLGINNDRITGYQIASNATDEIELKEIFELFIQTSRKCKKDLLNEIYKMGELATDSHSLNGKYINVWTEIKSVLNQKNRKMILTNCELGDDAAVKSYSKILDHKQNDVTRSQYTMINIQHTYIRLDHYKIKGICQSSI